MEVELKEDGRKINVRTPNGKDALAYINEIGRLSDTNKDESLNALLSFLKYKQTMILELTDEFKTLEEVQSLSADDFDAIIAPIEKKIGRLLGLANFTSALTNSQQQSQSISKS